MNFSPRNCIRILFICLVTLGLSQAAFAQTAHYTVTFDVTWSAVTHPTDFPSNAHFSGLVGGTHDASVSFWETGELASLGMKRMAEWGSQTELLAEVQTAIDAGMAETTITDDPLWTIPGSTSVDLQLTEDFSLVTLVAMIAPSPDWFIGVRDLDLAPGGVWAEEIVVDLFAFDAGTDSGLSYKSADQATVPPDPIAQINGYPFEVGIPLGTFTFTKQYVADVPDATVLQATVYPNPFNPQTTIAWELPATSQLRVDIHDVSGRLVKNLVNGVYDEGPGRTSWNGRDNSGNQASSGLYFARIITEGGNITRKITLAK